MKNILIVDDEHINRLSISLGLRKNFKTHNIPFTLYEASHGEDAIEIVGRNKVDIIIMDYQMPGLNGGETIHHLRKNGWDGIGIGYTSYSMGKVWEHFLKVGTNKVYSKHDDMPKMLEYINKSLGINSRVAA